jgi:hypothetical protein
VFVPFGLIVPHIEAERDEWRMNVRGAQDYFLDSVLTEFSEVRP